uniref:Uncharacterized protein n=1 Tax=Arundo donax TaxID=35708 RepID=A0A0A9DPP9_ARUDO
MSSMVSSPSVKPSTATRSPAGMHTPVSHGAEVRVHNMVVGFNRQILVQKLSKLNISQQSIESILLE